MKSGSKKGKKSGSPKKNVREGRSGRKLAGRSGRGGREGEVRTVWHQDSFFSTRKFQLKPIASGAIKYLTPAGDPQ